MREIWFAGLMALTLAGAFPAAAQAPKPADDAAAQNLLAPLKDDRVLGKPDAPITIIEYASLTCPHCAHFEGDVLPKLKEKWIDPGKAKLVLRAFPLDEPALRAEMVARCAAPERYFPLIETLFASQEKWVVAKDWQAALQRTAQLAGVPKAKFETCLADKALEDQVAQSRLTAAAQLSVNSTPTFFINGKKYDGEPTFEAFDKLLSGLAGKS
jgi:protein-disulfide isomerase